MTKKNMRLAWAFVAVTFICGAVVFGFQNCSMQTAAITNVMDQNSSGLTCDPNVVDTYLCANDLGTGHYACGVDGQEICVLDTCFDKNANPANQCGDGASSVTLTVNGLTSASIMPGPATLLLTLSADLTGVPVQLSITKFGGTCAATTTTPEQLGLPPSGVLTAGSYTLNYSESLAPLLGGCTWTLVAIASSGQSGTVQLTTLSDAPTPTPSPTATPSPSPSPTPTPTPPHCPPGYIWDGVRCVQVCTPGIDCP